MDDHFSSDFPFGLTDELFEFSFDPFPQDTISQSHETPLIPSHQLGSQGLLNNPESCNMEQGGQKSSADSREGDHHRTHGDLNKNKGKKVHKDIERQRRQEMSALYRSLRLELPVECLKGRRSISDHIHEGVKYIKHLKIKVKELNDKRDELKRLRSLYSTTDQGSFLQKSHLDTVKVIPSWPGVEVTVETAFRQGIPLSKVLEILLEEEGLSVVSSVSTKMNDKFLHTIRAEVSNSRRIDLAKLQQKLASLTA